MLNGKGTTRYQLGATKIEGQGKSWFYKSLHLRVTTPVPIEELSLQNINVTIQVDQEVFKKSKYV